MSSHESGDERRDERTAKRPDKAGGVSEPAAVERMLPPLSVEAAPWWEATRQRRLVVQWCPSCDVGVHYPRAACPRCLGHEMTWRQSEGIGTVHSASTMAKAASPGLVAMAPYVVALVDLDEGVRLMSNVVGCPPQEVVIGMRVRVSWEALPDGRHLPLFEPIAPSSSAP